MVWLVVMFVDLKAYIHACAPMMVVLTTEWLPWLHGLCIRG